MEKGDALVGDKQENIRYSPNDELIWFIILQSHAIPMVSRRRQDECKERREDKNSLCVMKYYTQLISALRRHLLLFCLGHFFPPCAY